MMPIGKGPAGKPEKPVPGAFAIGFLSGSPRGIAPLETQPMTRLIAAITLLGFLGACGSLRDSRLNPGNWFGGDREEKVVLAEGATYVDPRGLVAEIVRLKVDRMPGGAIITATGLPPTQGFFAGELVALNGELPDKGTLKYEFRLAPPPSPEQVVNQRSREVVVGYFVSDQVLAGVRRIEVLAQSNRRNVRR
jgi:hypothetical protein